MHLLCIHCDCCAPKECNFDKQVWCELWLAAGPPGRVGGGNTQCNYDKNWMPTIIWWILCRKTQHKLQYLALTELQALARDWECMGGSAPGRGVSSVSCKPSQLIPITPGRPGARLAQDCRLLISPLYCHLVINTALLLRATASRGQGRGNDSVLLDVTRCNVSDPLPSTLKQVLVSKLTLADGDPCILSNVSQLHRSIMAR